MLFTIQTNEPLVMVPETRYMQLLEVEGKVETDTADQNKMIGELIRFLVNNYEQLKSGELRIGETIELPSFSVVLSSEQVGINKRRISDIHAIKKEE